MDTKRQLSIEIQQLSKHRSLTITKYILNIILFLSMFYLVANNYPSTPVYIIVTLNVAPWIASGIIKEKISSNTTFILTMLMSKYNYSKDLYTGNQVGFILTLFLLAVWQLNYNRINPEPTLLAIFPLFLILLSMMLRFLLYIWYQIKIRYDLTNNLL